MSLLANEKRENSFHTHPRPGGDCAGSGDASHICVFRGALGPPSRLWVDSAASSRPRLPGAILQLLTLCPQNNVVGRLCNECSDGFFHLSKQNPDGCLKCFCMGVSRQCSSSSWSRAQVPTREWQLDGIAVPGSGGTKGGSHHHYHHHNCPFPTFPGTRGFRTALSVQPDECRRFPHHQ